MTPNPLVIVMLLPTLATLICSSGCSKDEHESDARAAVVTPVQFSQPQPSDPPTDMTRDDFHAGCSATGCHEQLGATRWVHGPVATNNCAACHTTVGEPEDHEFIAVDQNGTSCRSCHAAESNPKSLHAPFALGGCNACHDPHGGDRKSFIRTQTVGELCASCHEKPAHRFGHSPVELGDCLTCHTAHQSDHNSLLTRDPTELCYACHREKDFIGVLSVSTTMHQPAYVHEAMLTEGCLACHMPHGGDSPGMLAGTQSTLCLDCHQTTIQGLAEAQSVHGAFSSEESCTQCHEAHASEFAGLLRESPFDLCMSCHNEPHELANGDSIPDMQELIEQSPVVHAPAANGECSTCHAPHFSPQRSLLRVNYPNQMYTEFDLQAYAMCLECHDSVLAEEAFTPHTGFREGDQNLHFTHINREKGRSCDICHQPHAGNLPKLMREEFPFGPGGWKLPIGFTQTETGGTCTSACHEQRWYDNSYSLQLDQP